MFRKATKAKAKLRLALVGTAGAGKTYTALLLAKELGKSIAVIDSERGSASLYAGDVADFDVVELDEFSPDTYCKAIAAAADGGYEVLVIDSLSHAWSGIGGVLDQVDRRGGKFQNAWRQVTPMHNTLVDAVLSYPGHVIATLRAKPAYSVEQDKNGKSTVRKLGLAPVQREGVDHEFTLVGDMGQDHTLTITKSRCPLLADQVIRKPGKGVADTLKAWLSDGVDLSQVVLDAVTGSETLEDLASAKGKARSYYKQLSPEEQKKVTEAIKAKQEALTPTEEESAA